MPQNRIPVSTSGTCFPRTSAHQPCAPDIALPCCLLSVPMCTRDHLWSTYGGCHLTHRPMRRTRVRVSLGLFPPSDVQSSPAVRGSGHAACAAGPPHALPVAVAHRCHRAAVAARHRTPSRQQPAAHGLVLAPQRHDTAGVHGRTGGKACVACRTCDTPRAPALPVPGSGALLAHTHGQHAPSGMRSFLLGCVKSARPKSPSIQVAAPKRTRPICTPWLHQNTTAPTIW